MKPSTLLLLPALPLVALSLTTTLLPAQPPRAKPPAKLAPFFRPPDQYAKDFGDYRSPLLFNDGTRVKDAAGWKKRRQEILDAWHKQMGAWPPLLDRPKTCTLPLGASYNHARNLNNRRHPCGLSSRSPSFLGSGA